MSETIDELIAQAADYGLVVDKRYSAEKIKAMIEAERKVIEAKPTKADIASQRKVRLTIHKTDGDTGSDNVPVSVNGKTWLIKRGVEVEVPAFVVEVLRNAVRDVYDFDERHNEIHRREVPAYPFSASV